MGPIYDDACAIGEDMTVLKPGAAVVRSSDDLTGSFASALRLPLLGLSLFLAFLFLRPADLVPALAVFRPALVVLALTTVVFLLQNQGIVFIQYSTGKLLLVFWGAMALSTVVSYWPGGSFWITVDFLKEIVVFVLIINTALSLHALGRLIKVMIFSNGILAMFAVRDYLTGNVSASGRIQGVVSGLFDDPNDLALSLITMVPLIYWIIQTRATRRGRLLFIVLMVVVVSGVVATQSRGGFIALLGVAFMIVKESRKKMVAIFLCAIIAVAVILVAPRGAFDRFSTITSYQGEETAQIRMHMWAAGVQMFADHPVLGVGTGMFSAAYGKDYRDPGFPYNTWWTAHNTVIQVSAEMGLLGLALWIGLVISGFSSLRTARRRISLSDLDDRVKAPLSWMISALQTSLAGFILGAMFLSRAYDWILVIILAMIIAFLRMTERLSLDRAEVRWSGAPRSEPLPTGRGMPRSRRLS